MTIQNHDIEQVAGIIADYPWAADFSSVREFATQQNTEGWSYDVQYGTEGEGNWTYVERIHLSPIALGLAIRLAEEWEQGNEHLTAPQLRKQLAGR